MTEPIALVSCGPPEHGISAFAAGLAAAARQQGFRGTVLHEPRPPRLADVANRLPTGIRLVHLHVNDWLFGDSARSAQDRVVEFAAHLRDRGANLSLTLHDLPQQAVSPFLFLRRATTYVAMSTAAVGVVVCSDHERSLLEEAAAVVSGGPDRGTMPVITVIPLPVPDPPPVRTRPIPRDFRSVGVLGFIYPGKGHQEVIEELAGVTPAVLVAAIGRPSDGHEAMVQELTDLGRSKGIDFICTGYLSDPALNRRLGEIAVPIAPHPQVSASASINSWIAAGRRPLVIAGRYTRELAERMPGSVHLYTPGRLRPVVETALKDPSLTYLPTGFRPGPGNDQVASRYLHWLRSQITTPAG